MQGYMDSHAVILSQVTVVPVDSLLALWMTKNLFSLSWIMSRYVHQPKSAGFCLKCSVWGFLRGQSGQRVISAAQTSGHSKIEAEDWPIYDANRFPLYVFTAHPLRWALVPACHFVLESYIFRADAREFQFVLSSFCNIINKQLWLFWELIN